MSGNQGGFSELKTAIVCDWLTTYAGAERVLEQILELYPLADLFCVVDFIPPEKRGFIKNKKTTTSFIQRLPFAEKSYRRYLPLMPLAIEQLDLSGYDLVISSSHAVAKGVITDPDSLHISYVNSPMRYAWDLQNQYLKEAKLDTGVKSYIARIILHYMRLWDNRTANGVDCFVANSKFIARRIKKVYGRESTVIYPPVNVEKFTPKYDKEAFYLTASRMVPYKKMKLIVEAFSQMPDKKLVVIGDGPDRREVEKAAGKNVAILGYQPDEILKSYMQKAKAFVFAAKEDFGITPLEAQACGTPVIAYGRGGALETVIEGETGIFFPEQTAESLKAAVERFENTAFDGKACRKNAERFSNEIFRSKFKAFVDECLKSAF